MRLYRTNRNQKLTVLMWLSVKMLLGCESSGRGRL